MTLPSTRPASLRALALAALLGSALIPSLAQSSPQVDNPTVPPVAVPIDFQPAKSQLPPIPMPPDRAADSYHIYSVLLPVGELGGPGWPRKLWLLSDTTVPLVPPDQPCLAQEIDGINMNPHVAIIPPPDRVQDFNELLDDFDHRCHESIQLTAESFNLVVPLRLLNQTEQDEFIRSRFDPNASSDADVLTAHYKGAPGLSRFSEVYFNAHHTVAMVYATSWCGGLCAQSYWEVLAFEDGAWKPLGWRSAAVMS